MVTYVAAYFLLGLSLAFKRPAVKSQLLGISVRGVPKPDFVILSKDRQPLLSFLAHVSMPSSLRRLKH